MNTDTHRIAETLRELFGRETQQATATRLTGLGLPTDQPKVSAWRTGKSLPSLSMLTTIETAYGMPRGWILHAAGYVDLDGLIEWVATRLPGNTGDADDTEPAALRLPTRLAALEDELAAMRAAIGDLRAAAASASARRPGTE